MAALTPAAFQEQRDATSARGRILRKIYTPRLGDNVNSESVKTCVFRKTSVTEKVKHTMDALKARGGCDVTLDVASTPSLAHRTGPQIVHVADEPTRRRHDALVAPPALRVREPPSVPPLTTGEFGLEFIDSHAPRPRMIR
jgi:hypothetical protein